MYAYHFIKKQMSDSRMSFELRGLVGSALSAPIICPIRKDLYYPEDNNLDNKGNGYYSKDGAISARALLTMTVEGYHRTIAKTARWVIYSLNVSGLRDIPLIHEI